MYNFIYFFAALVLCSGLFIMITSDNYIRKLIGLAIFQNSVLIFYVALGKVSGGIVPVDICLNKGIENCAPLYSSPLPHVLMLTAIVVGFSTMSVGLALIYQMHKNFNSVSEQQILINCNEKR